jgi:hypothetical protein
MDDTQRHTLARWIFLSAGLYGLVMLLPQYFLEETVGRLFPPAVTHPDFYYGFLGAALTWHFAFFLIVADVQRYRPLMLIAALEKLAYGVAVLVLYHSERVAALVAGAGVIDLGLAVLFLAAFRLVHTPPLRAEGPRTRATPATASRTAHETP